MKRIKTRLYVIPGLGETTRSRNYSGLIHLARKLGFDVRPINIYWSQKKNMTNFLAEAEGKLPKDISKDYVLGFSMGAYIAAVLSPNKRAKGYIFCSTSPFFKEDIKRIPKATKKYFGSKMINSFKKYSFPKNIPSRAWFLIGDQDWKIAIEKTRKIFKSWPGKKSLYLIKGAGHELNHSKYTERLEKILKTLRQIHRSV